MAQAAEPYSEHWENVMTELLELDFTLDPTFNISEASRDLQRARRAEWHEDYTLPSLLGVLPAQQNFPRQLLARLGHGAGSSLEK